MSDAPILRCEWCGDDPLYIAYHDEEWGVPNHDDRVHFEFLVLESAQAGLSWITILKKRESYRTAFADFDPDRVARFSSEDIDALLLNEGIVRNRAKITSTIGNARAFLDIVEEFGSFDAYLWRFVDGVQKRNRRRSLDEVPAETDESRALSKDLKARGMKFVGPTIMYAHMQAVGLVNDHVERCFRYAEINERFS